VSSLPDVALGDPAETHRVGPPEDAPEETSARALGPTPVGTAVELVSADLPDADLGGSRMTGPERAWTLVRHWFRLAAKTTGELTANPGVIGSDPPESFAEYRTYVRSRAWIPDGYDGRWLVWVPLAYYNTVGNLGFAADGLGWVFKRMFRFVAAVVLIAVAVVLWLCFS
jgi:hypothetical protein